MKRKIYLSTIILILSFQISGCGKIENDVPITSVSSNTSVLPEETSGNNISSETNIIPSAEPVIEPEEPETTNKPEKIYLSFKKAYSDVYRTVSILGLKEYKKLGGKTYTDKPKKGNIFLVLFLSIRNTTDTQDYINVNYISAKVDGKKIEHTFLVNEPKNYPTIFTHIEANSSIGGFIVWEVPKDWKKLNMSYEGWKYSNNISVKANLTPDNLSNPKIYNKQDYTF